jgi:hypothetical protein
MITATPDNHDAIVTFVSALVTFVVVEAPDAQRGAGTTWMIVAKRCGCAPGLGLR